MATAISHLNLIKMIEDNLADRIKRKLTATLIEKSVKEYRAKILPEIEKLVKDLVIDDVKALHGCMNLRDEFNVYIHMRD